MGKRVFFRLGITLMLLTVCSACGWGLRKDERIADRITARAAKKIEKKTGLRLIGTGGQMMYEIEMLAMSFNYYQEVDIDQARELVVYAVQTYLDEINNDKKIRQYLANYPFTAKNVEIAIFPHTKEGRNPPLGGIICVSSGKRGIRYYVSVPDKYSRREIHKESYEEALSRVKQ